MASDSAGGRHHAISYVNRVLVIMMSTSAQFNAIFRVD